ncbi:MAG: PAS domain-containing protein [Deltaproteobacteria bacterium]|nr:PAS domain-containing protein [Deltaproteobacteria bacterium]
MDSQLCDRIFGAFPIALAVVEPELVIEYANANFTKLFAVEGEVVGLGLEKFLPFAEIRNLVDRAGRERKSKEAELKLRLAQGRGAFFKLTLIPFALESDEDSLFLVTLEDVGERTRLEEQLLQAEKLSAMGHMAASIAHELGNPLSVMITSLEYLHHCLDPSNTELEEQIAMMEENAVRMHELLTSLADMSGQGRFQREKEDIHKAVMPVLSFVRKMAEKSAVTVETDLASDLPPCYMDSRELKQVFLNLLKNAIEAMPNGGTIAVRSWHCIGVESAEEGCPLKRGCIGKQGCVIVEFEDTGNGVPSADLETIFKPFYSTKKKGMGLGLSLCRGIIEKHGGKIWATSQEGKGSCFIVEIPVDQNL